MPRYAAPFSKTGADNVRQLVEILSTTTTQRQKWYAFIVGAAAAADNVLAYVVRRVTGSATGTALTPRPLDKGDAACRSTAEHAITVDHSSFNTSPVELWRSAINQRAATQWMASEGREMVGEAIDANGLSLGLHAQSTVAYDGTINFEE